MKKNKHDVFKENILLFFSKVFYMKKINFNKEKIVKILKQLEYVDSGANDHSSVENITAFSKTGKLLENQNFFNLKSIILKEFNFFKNNYLRYTKTNFKITTSWVSKSIKNQSSNYHAHKNSFYSGIFYVQTDADCGGISFENFFNTNSIMIKPEDYNIYNSNEYKINIMDGLLLFFPSEIHHKILRNNSNIERYAISFNIMPVGEIGVGDSSLVIGKLT